MSATDLFTRLQAALAERYALQRELGHGGMATVYLAQDRKHTRPVAIKVLRPEIAATLGPERFLREIEIAARLTHPHMLPLLDSGAAAGFLYYVMPYVEGESLRDRLDREPQLPLADALQITREVADALSYAHGHNVLHRDIKPENILLESGHAVVSDFGIARAITAAGGEKLTETGISVGTPAYMSPEQAGGGQPLDGRSDLYNLVCVLYEMLAGEPPFTGPSAEAIVRQHLAAPAPRIGALRAAVPPAVEQAIARALAKVPGDRFATVAAFAEALVAPAPQGRRFPRAAGAAAVVVAIGIVAAVLITRAKPDSALDPNLVAVAPFDVFEPSLALWREGLMDILARNFDGAGPLRTVSPTVVVRRWHGRADPASAADLGRRTGARVTVIGSLVSAGADSVRLTARLLDVGTGRTIGEVDLRDAAARVDRLADSATYALLAAMGRTTPVGAPRPAALRSRSLLALKAFLRGEQFYRQFSWDSAGAYYAQAAGIDSTFALPVCRLAWMGQWGYGYRPATESPLGYLSRAAALNRGLAPRDSLLLAADSLFAALENSAAWWTLPPGQFRPMHSRLVLLLNQATQQYPDDPEFWYVRGEAQAHFGYYDGTTARQAFETFDRAIALDSSFAPAYGHPIMMALTLEDDRAAQRYLDGYARATAEEPDRAGRELIADLHRADGDSTRIERLLDGLPPKILYEAWNLFARSPDPMEVGVRAARRLATRPGFDPFPDSRYLHATLAYRGHLREALPALLAQARSMADSDWVSPYGWRSLYYAAEQGWIKALSPEDAHAVDRLLRHAGDVRLFNLGGSVAWWGVRKDTAALSRTIHQADSVLRTGGYHAVGCQPACATLDSVTATWVRSEARAYLALARHDTAQALRDFSELPEHGCPFKCLLDELFRLRGEARANPEAYAHRLASDPPGSADFALPRATEVLWVLERARANEQVANREAAIPAYRFVADVWRSADPELQPYVAEARAALKRLGAERR